jgi:hypothetical protein
MFDLDNDGASRANHDHINLVGLPGRIRVRKVGQDVNFALAIHFAQRDIDCMKG